MTSGIMGFKWKFIVTSMVTIFLMSCTIWIYHQNRDNRNSITPSQTSNGISQVNQGKFTDGLPAKKQEVSVMTPSQPFSYFSQVNQDKFVDGLLAGRHGGFFVECGAGDGVQFSNSLFFERHRGWTGLLIEADPETFHSLQKNKRQAHLQNNCLSLDNTSPKLKFQIAKTHYIGGLVNGFEKQHSELLKDNNEFKSVVDVQCYPLQSMLKSLNVTHVDYFSLDVEGPELNILQSIPWNKLTIDIITVEFRILKSNKRVQSPDWEESAKKFHKIKNYMVTVGYQLAGTLPEEDIPERALDMVFKRISE